MKNYHTKKFFYNFYWRKSFRNALLGHYAWTLFLAVALMPLGYAAFRLSGWGGVVALIPLALIAFIHLAVIWILAMYGLLRSVCCRRARLLTWLLVFFNGLMPLAMAWYIVKKRAWAAGICCAGLLAGEIVFGTVGQSLSWGWRLLMLLACALFYLIMLLTLPDRRKLNGWFLLPLVLTGGVVTCVYTYNTHLESVVRAQEKEIADLVGFSIDSQSFIVSNQNAVSLKDSPLAGLMVEDTFYIRNEESKDSSKEIKDFLDKNPGFRKAINALDTVKLFDIKEDDLSEKNLMIGGNFHYMRCFRSAARFIAAEMKLNAADKAFVVQCNNRLTKLRDILYADRGGMLIGRLVGVAIDAIRFDALGNVVGQGKITPEEAAELAGPAPDMRRNMALSMADEAANAVWIWEHLQDLKVLAVLASNGDGGEGRSLKDVPPWERMTYVVKSFFLADRIFYNKSIINFIKKNQQSVPPDYKAWRQLEDQNLKETRDKGYIFTAMLLPSLASAAERFDMFQCYYTILPAAAQVMQYYKARGALPESLKKIGIELEDHKNSPVGFRRGKFISPYNQTMELDGFMIYVTYSNQPEKIGTSLVVELGPRRKLPEPEEETSGDLL